MRPTSSDYLGNPDAFPTVRTTPAAMPPVAAPPAVYVDRRYLPPPPAAPAWADTIPYGPGGVVTRPAQPPEPPPALHVPFRMAAGMDAPMIPGGDFADWISMQRRPPPISALDAPSGPPEEGTLGRLPSSDLGDPASLEGGAERMALNSGPHAGARMVMLPPVTGQMWDEQRRAGIRPPSDLNADWRAAVQRSQGQQPRRQVGEPMLGGWDADALRAQRQARAQVNTPSFQHMLTSLLIGLLTGGQASDGAAPPQSNAR